MKKFVNCWIKKELYKYIVPTIERQSYYRIFDREKDGAPNICTREGEESFGECLEY